MIELIRELTNLSGLSGDEGEVADAIIRQAKKYASEIKKDAAGNLYVLRRGRKSGRRIMVDAHMDEVGLIANTINESGFISFLTVGGIDSRVIVGTRVKVGRNKVPGVIATKAMHLQTEAERKTAPAEDSLYVDIGARNMKKAQQRVSPGDSILFDTEFSLFGEGRIKAKALDNRVGCAAALVAMRQQPLYDTVFAFTVQEEIGLKGARCAAYNVRPDFAIVVDTTTAADIPDVAAHEQACALAGGTVLFVAESTTIYKKEHLARQIELAETGGVNYQIKNLIAGGLDSGAIQRSREGIETVALATPCRYIHSPNGVADMADCEATARMLGLMLSDEKLLNGAVR